MQPVRSSRCGLVSNCCNCTQSAVVVRSGLAGNYFVVAVFAVLVSLGLNEYNAGCFVVQAGDGGAIGQGNSALDGAIGGYRTCGYVRIVAVGLDVLSVLNIGVYSAQTGQSVTSL